MRKTEFANGEFYHIYNRGVDKRDIFLDENDYGRFILSMNLFNSEKSIGSIREKLKGDKKTVADRASTPVQTGFESLSANDKLVTFIAYCLNPNHYHFILKQKKENGITKFMKKLGGGYTSYFNKKHKRSGSLFQGKFKSIHIDSNEYLLYLSAYVNKNNFIHGYKNRNWQYSSLLDYLGKRNGKLCDKSQIIDQFNNVDEYADFVEENADYFKTKKELEKYMLE